MITVASLVVGAWVSGAVVLTPVMVWFIGKQRAAGIPPSSDFDSDAEAILGAILMGVSWPAWVAFIIVIGPLLLVYRAASRSGR